MHKLSSFLDKHSKADVALFVIAILVVSFNYEYNRTVHDFPQSIHNWRQADCASFALQYYNNGMNFLEPKVFNVLMGEGNCAGECPILYYLIACIYKIFWPSDFIFRLVIMLIFFFGLISLFKICKSVLNDRFFAFVIPLLLFSSPLIMLFGNNFLCDVPSLSFTFIAWNYFLNYIKEKKIKHFWFSMLFFAVAGLLKLNGAISFVALGALFFIELCGWQKENTPTIFVHRKKNIIGFSAAIIIIAAWYLWAIGYNTKFDVQFLGTKTWPGWPIWETTDQNFLHTMNGLIGNSVQLFYQASSALLIFLFLFVVINRREVESFYFNILLLVFIGVSIFICTFFFGVVDNVYYFINLFIFPVFILITACMILKNKYPKVFHSLVFRFIILGFLLMNINYAMGTLKDFYHEGKWHFRTNRNFEKEEFRKFIDSIGIGKTEKVISFPDRTPDVTLYAINRIGWSEYNFSHPDTIAINNCIKKGAKYLIINDPNWLADPIIENYTGNYVANFDNIYVYKLGAKQKNYRNKKVRIATADNKFVSTDIMSSGKNLIALDSLAGQDFYLINYGNGKVEFRTDKGEFISFALNDDKKLFIGSTWVGTWEVFDFIYLSDNRFALRAVNGKYVSLKQNEGHILKANADKIGSDETFEFK